MGSQFLCVCEHPWDDDQESRLVLQNTFLHLKGMGEVSEKRLWKSGIRTWEDFLASCESSSRKAKGPQAEGIRVSQRHYESGLWSYFDQQIPSRHKWRAIGDLADRALFVDIETTGLADSDSVTMIGTYDGADFRVFIQGQNMDEAQEVLEAYPLVVTFNGACFDLPMIRKRFPYILFNHIHVDLRYPLKNLGYAGGLKIIEKRLGINRSDETEGLDGWDAVRLWRDHQCGDKNALETLIKYNEEDVRNMKPLMDFVFATSRKRLKALADD